MQDVLIGDIDLPGDVRLTHERGEIVVSPGETTEIRLKLEGGMADGDVVVSGDLSEGRVEGNQLILKLKAPERVGRYLLQVRWPQGETILPLHVMDEYVVMEAIDVEENLLKVRLRGPENKKIRGELTVEGIRGGRRSLFWKRRVAVKGEISLSIILPGEEEQDKLLLTFRKGELRVEESVSLKREEKAEEVPAEDDEEEAPPERSERGEEVRERKRVKLKGVVKVPVRAGPGGLFPSEKVLKDVKIGECWVKILSSPTLIVEGENPLLAISTILYTSPSQVRRWRELKRWAEGLRGLYPPGKAEEAERWIEETKGVILKALEGDEEGEKELSDLVERELKSIKGLESLEEEELYRLAGGWLSAIDDSLTRSLSVLEKGPDPEAVTRAVSSELLSAILSLKMIFLWERGVYEAYPGLKNVERRSIKGCVQASETVLKRLGYIMEASREILRRNRENRAVREALEALGSLKVELKGVEGEVMEGGRMKGELIIKGDGRKRIKLFLSFKTPSHIVILKPPVSYSEGVLKSEPVDVKGEVRIPLLIEVLRGVSSDRATVEVAVNPLLPPLKREIPEGGEGDG